MSKTDKTESKLRGARLDALEEMRKQDVQAAEAREAFRLADVAWREHLRDARNAEAAA